MVVAALVGASETSVVTGLTELVRRLGKGEGVSSTVPVAFSRTMKAHDMEEALRVVRTEVALEAKVAFLKGTDRLLVGKDPTGESDISREASRTLVRALAASCLGEDLRRMVESYNRDRSADEALTFDEFTQWLHGEVGGKFPLTSYLKGLHRGNSFGVFNPTRSTPQKPTRRSFAWVFRLFYPREASFRWVFFFSGG